MIMIERNRMLVIMAIVAFVVGMIIGPAPAEAQSHNVNVNINGSQLSSDVPPLIVDEHTLVPMRAIFDALGATVEWNDLNQSATGRKGDTRVQFTLGSMTAMVNGEEVTLEVPLMIVDGRVLVPVGFLSTVLGMDVQWNEASGSVDITDSEEEDAAEDENGTDDEDSDNSHYNYNAHENYNSHDNGNNSHENYNLHYNYNSHENGENYHENYNYHYNNNEHHNNGHQNDENENGDSDIVSPATVTITELSSVTPEAGGVMLVVKGTVANAPEKYALLLKIGIPSHGSVMLWNEYGYGDSGIVSDGTFSLSYLLEPGQEQYQASIINEHSVSSVVIRPDTETDPAVKLLAIARSDYTTSAGEELIAYNIIAKNSTGYLISTRHGLDINEDPVLGADKEAMHSGSIVGNLYLTNTRIMDKIEFYDNDVLSKTYTASQISAMINKLPSGY